MESDSAFRFALDVRERFVSSKVRRGTGTDFSFLTDGDFGSVRPVKGIASEVGDLTPDSTNGTGLEVFLADARRVCEFVIEVFASKIELDLPA